MRDEKEKMSIKKEWERTEGRSRRMEKEVQEKRYRLKERKRAGHEEM